MKYSIKKQSTEIARESDFLLAVIVAQGMKGDAIVFQDVRLTLPQSLKIKTEKNGYLMTDCGRWLYFQDGGEDDMRFNVSTMPGCTVCQGKGYLNMINDTHGPRVEKCDTCDIFEDDAAAKVACDKDTWRYRCGADRLSGYNPDGEQYFYSVYSIQASSAYGHKFGYQVSFENEQDVEAAMAAMSGKPQGEDWVQLDDVYGSQAYQDDYFNNEAKLMDDEERYHKGIR